MTEESGIDFEAVHKHFSSVCFNKAWDRIEKKNRSAEDDEEMIRLSITSTWHWTQSADCTVQNISVGYWQTSRIYSILGQTENAKRYGHLCLKASQGDDVPPFYLGYAYEALARAEMVAGDKKKMGEYLQEARRVAELVSDSDSKQMLLDDLDIIS